MVKASSFVVVFNIFGKFFFLLLLCPSGRTYDPRAASSKRHVVVAPAVATRSRELVAERTSHKTNQNESLVVLLVCILWAWVDFGLSILFDLAFHGCVPPWGLASVSSAVMGAIHKMAPLGSAGHFCTRMHVGCMAGCLRPRKTHLRKATFCSFCFDTVRVILTDDLCVRRT